MRSEENNQKKVVAWGLFAVGILLMAEGVLRDEWRCALGALIPLGTLAGMQRRILPAATWLLMAIGLVLIAVGALRDERLYAAGALVPISLVVWYCVNSRVAARPKVAAMQ